MARVRFADPRSPSPVRSIENWSCSRTGLRVAILSAFHGVANGAWGVRIVRAYPPLISETVAPFGLINRMYFCHRLHRTRSCKG